MSIKKEMMMKEGYAETMNTCIRREDIKSVINVKGKDEGQNKGFAQQAYKYRKIIEHKNRSDRVI